jgi:signal transduction histidine kinase
MKLMREIPSDDRLEELTTLVGGLAHEIKNPLSTIAINLQLLREDWSGESGPVALRSVAKLDVLAQESRRLERMLAEFLRLLSPGDLDLELRDIGLVLEEVLVFLTPQLEKQGVQVVSQIERTGLELSFDRNLMKQVFINLLKNAAEAMGDQGGTLTIQAGRTGDQVVIDLIDTGPGMSQETRERIFQPYFSTKAAGTGLGLVMVKRILERHRGRVLCESAAGSGTRFRIELPIGNAEPGEQA